MAHGGTSFGQWSGANAPPYAPTVSSYDYDAPIDEAGHTTPKFFAIRELLKNYLHANETLGEIPKDPVPLITIPAIRFTQTAALFNNLPKPVISEDIQPMEMFNQGWGRILYRTTIPAAAYKRKLVLTEVHDWAVVFVNGKEAGKLDRRMAGNNTITLPPLATAARLDILVETTGRVNYGQAITDRKGITSSVVLTGGTDTTIVKHWQVYNFPVDYAFQQKRTYQHTTAQGPAWYKASFNLAVTGDTYLDLSQWGKGMVWVNGHNLGRFWKIGPTQSMFLPGSWLKKGSNEIIVLDVDKPAVATISGGTKPVYHLNPDESLLHRKKGQQLQLAAEKPVAEGVLEPGNGWKTVLLPQVQSGRYFCFEALSAQDEKDQLASIAEMEITGEEGTTISSLQWKVVYADSEEVMAANSTADKLYDLQESVIWQTEKGGPGYPHQIVIDLGSNIKVKGFRLLPRTDKSKAGMIKRYRFYLKEAPFAL
jgi:beta-galactosidase